MLKDSPTPVLRDVTVEDYAEVKNRGLLKDIMAILGRRKTAKIYEIWWRIKTINAILLRTKRRSISQQKVA